MIRALTLFGLFLFAPSPTVDNTSTSDPLANLPTEHISIELKDAPVDDVFRLVGDIAAAPVVVDSCVEGTLDLKLNNVSLRMLLEAMAQQLTLDYSTTPEGELHVSCGARDEGTTVTMNVRGLAIEEVVTSILSSTNTTARVQGCGGRLVDLEVQHAPVAAIIAGIAADIGAEHRWTPDGVVFRCR